MGICQARVFRGEKWCGWRTRARMRGMAVYIALLRGINVVGRNRVAMADLRELMTSCGFEGGRSLLQSGNLVFRGTQMNSAALERLLETETSTRCGVAVD